jgi:mannose-6-phosphate isomerase-like protein (cupin superfamily)
MRYLKMNKINLLEKLSRIHTYWDPKIIGELNNQYVKLVKFKGEFVWHKHEKEDELFLVVKGEFDMQFRDRTITLNEKDLIVIPRGTEHCPKAKDEVHVLLFEPVTTLNTGDVRSDKTINNPEKI